MQRKESIVCLAWLLALGACSSSDERVEELVRRVSELEARLAGLERDGDTLRLSGANLQIVNGLGATKQTNGLGNLILGYNEPRTKADDPNQRSGSHTLVIGEGNNFSSYAGIVVGRFNEISAPFAGVTAGRRNVASGLGASVTGGVHGTASGTGASVTGGRFNEAAGVGASVVGGEKNRAAGDASSIAGGVSNRTQASGSHVSGGEGNLADAVRSVVSGGRDRTAPGSYDWRAGSLLEEQ